MDIFFLLALVSNLCRARASVAKGFITTSGTDYFQATIYMRL